jgi:hypothetical protein
MKIRSEAGLEFTVGLAEKATVVKVAPGETSLQNASPIAFASISPGDRVLVRGGASADGRIDGALRIVVMAMTDLAAREESEQRAWRERGVAGTLIAAEPAKSEFTIRTGVPAQAPSGAPPSTPGSLVVDAGKATIHRYADTSVKFVDAQPATVAELAEGDQVRVLGTRSADGARMTAERVVFGHFRTMALAIEKVDQATGLLSVKDLQSNRKFMVSILPSASIRRIPAEMAAMFAALSGFGAGRPGGPPPEGTGAPAGTRPGDSRPGGGRAPDPGRTPGMGGHGPGGGARAGRTMEDMIEKMPVITVADLKKDDWVGAVVGTIDASDKATAFNMLAGIEVFASRANRSGGVDVGMPAGLLDGAFGVP